MPYRQILKVAIKSLQTNKTRSLLTMLGIIIGVASVILLVALGSGLQKYVTDQFESLGSSLFMVLPGNVDLKKLGSGPPNFSTSKLEANDAKDLVQSSSLIGRAMPEIMSQAPVKFEGQKVYAQIVGVTEDYPHILNTSVEKGDFFSGADDRSSRKVAVLGSKVTENLFLGSDPLGEKVIIGDERFTVLGVLKSKGGFGGDSVDEQVVIPIGAAKRLFNKDNVNMIYVQAKNSDDVDQAIEETKLILANRLKEDDFTVINQKDLLGTISSILGMLTIALAGIAAISLLVGGIGIMNIMLVSVTERTKEIGLRKALGATPGVILSQFLAEAVILSVGGGLIGILLGGGGALALSQVAPVQVTWGAVLLAFSVSAAVGIIFGVMPARRAAKLSPIEALRYE